MEIGTLNECIKAVKVAVPLYVVAMPNLEICYRMYMGRSAIQRHHKECRIEIWGVNIVQFPST
jgi:hypothetical protein